MSLLSQVAETPAEQQEVALALPERPKLDRPNGFPYVMVIAPVIIAGVLFAVLQSPYVLIFAVFGPVLGIANVIDQRVGGRRRYRRALKEYEHEAEQCLGQARAAHDRIRVRARIATPIAEDIVRGARVNGTAVALGTTSIRGELRTSGANAELASRVSTTVGMPVAVETRCVVVSGEAPGLIALARAVLVGLLATDPSARLAVAGSALGQLRAELLAAGVQLDTCAEADLILAAHVPRDVDDRAQLQLEADGSATLVDASGVVTRIVPAQLGAPQLRAWLPTVVEAQDARRRAEQLLPNDCRLDDLAVAAARPGSAAFLLDAAGVRSVDLISDGPHAVIGGTTGSGKSELLVAWAVALAKHHTSSELTMLCLDFKGGATFDALASLPHCAGIVTDLDGDDALRVSESLRAELRRREQWLRDHGLRDLAPEGVAGMTRLVVFIDEFQALVGAHPHLQELIADVAARGRSLGIHLVMCTQRPTGTFREELLANCSLRICLRVEQSSDSQTLLGNTDAIKISAAQRGRAWLRIGGVNSLVQVARAGQPLIERIARHERARLRHAGGAAPHALWHPPLPSLLAASDLPSAGTDELVFGVVDLPSQQARRAATLRAGQQLFVLGAGGCGRTTTIDTLAEAARGTGWEVVRVPRDAEGAWDAIERLSAAPEVAPRHRLVVIDDLDAIEQRLGDEHRAALLDRLHTLLRHASERATSVVVSARRCGGQLLRIQQQCDQTLRLTHATRNDWILQGGEPADWQPNWAPGRGRLGRDLVQVAVGQPTSEEEPAQPRWLPFSAAAGGVAIVARRGAPIAQALERSGASVLPPPSAATLREHGLGDANYLGDVEQWLGAYGSLARVAEHRDVALIGITPGEWRSLFRADPLPPAVRDLGSRGFLRTPQGTVRRLQVRDGVPIAIEAMAAT
jgi:S-DNA-T family DNA segregation ATPase FtsK/SpoIIIE